MQFLLMPGMDGTGELFAPLLNALPASLSVQTLSYPKREPLTYEELLPIVRTALPSGPFVLVAESFSGPLAVMAAAEHPPGLFGVVLCATFIRNPVWWAHPILRHAISGFAFRLFPAVARVRGLLGAYGTPDLRRLVAKAQSGVAPAVLAQRARAILTVNVEQQLRACAVPILYIRGSHDELVPISSLTRIQAVVPSVQVVTVPSAHMILQIEPEACARAILEFASRKSV